MSKLNISPGPAKTLKVKGFTIPIVSAGYNEDGTTTFICKNTPICDGCGEDLKEEHTILRKLRYTQINDNTFCSDCKEKAIKDQELNEYYTTDFY